MLPMGPISTPCNFNSSSFFVLRTSVTGAALAKLRPALVNDKAANLLFCVSRRGRVVNVDHRIHSTPAAGSSRGAAEAPTRSIERFSLKLLFWWRTGLLPEVSSHFASPKFDDVVTSWHALAARPVYCTSFLLETSILFDFSVKSCMH